MEEVANQSSEQEIVQTEVAPPETEASQEVKVEEKQPEEKSWVNKLRRDQDDAIREAKMAKDLLERVMTQPIVNKASLPVEEDILEQIQKEEYVPGEKVVKALRKQSEDHKREIEELKKMMNQKQYSDSISDLKRDYPDLEEVVNPDTLELVKQSNPRLAKSWAGMDDYSIYVQAYPYIKNAGLLNDATQTKRAKETEKKIEQNKKIVQSPAVFDKRPMAQAFKPPSQAEKEQLFEEMTHFANQSGGGY